MVPSEQNDNNNVDALTAQMQAEMAKAIEATPKAPEEPASFEVLHKRAKVLPPIASRDAIPVGENVVLPKHYSRFQIEPIRFIGENKLNFFQGNIVKYILRFDAKNGLEDVRKAKRYCRMFELYLEGNPNWWGPDPQAKELTDKLEAVFTGFREFVGQYVETPEVRAQLLAQINIMEAQFAVKPS